VHGRVAQPRARGGRPVHGEQEAREHLVRGQVGRQVAEVAVERGELGELLAAQADGDGVVPRHRVDPDDRRQGVVDRRRRPAPRVAHGPQATSAETTDVKKRRPSVPRRGPSGESGPKPGSTACSGCGMSPTTLPAAFVMPAMSRREPLGFQSW